MLRLVTWATEYPTAALGFSGWNITCLRDRKAPLCDDTEQIMFVRQAWDFMCQPESSALYGLQHCISRVSDQPHGADVLMGVSGPLYRRSMFDSDFLHVPTLITSVKLAEVAARAHADAAAAEANEEEARAPADKADKRLKEKRGHNQAAAAAAGVKRNATRPLPQPKASTYLVDDVVISAYLAHKGVPALIVPGRLSVELAQRSMSLRREYQFAPAPPPPPSAHAQDEQRQPALDTVNALHAEENFDLMNHDAVHYFLEIKWW